MIEQPLSPSADADIARHRAVLDRLVRAQGIPRFAAFLTTGEGSFFPTGIEETSGYVIDDGGRIYRFWTGWDDALQTERLDQWGEIGERPGWATNGEYQRARAAVGLPTAPNAVLGPRPRPAPRRRRSQTAR